MSAALTPLFPTLLSSTRQTGAEVTDRQTYGVRAFMTVIVWTVQREKEERSREDCGGLCVEIQAVGRKDGRSDGYPNSHML